MTNNTPDQDSTPAQDDAEAQTQTPTSPPAAEDAGHLTAETPEQAESPEQADPEELPSTETLEEPSTEKDPGEEPKAPKRDEPEPDHEAVGIGVIDTEEPQAG